jgi:glutamine amidotransferase
MAAMCRLFAQVAPSPAGARDLLVDSPFALARQAVADPANPQTDGWGLAWFDPSGRPTIEKSGASAAADARRFEAAADAARGTVLIGHIRAASKGIAVDDAHAHPFADGPWVFAHNGTLFIKREVAAGLGSRRDRLKTDSDSEVYFQQFLKHLDATDDPSRAYEACVVENWRLWMGCARDYPGKTAPYSSLNALASDGKGLHALCHAASMGLARVGVCHPGQHWQVMSFAERDGRFVLASEGVDGGDWTLLSPPETLSVLPGRKPARRSLDLARSVGHPVPEASRQ